jgi:hypothetical protein
LKNLQNTAGTASLQNTLTLSISLLKHIPQYGHRQVRGSHNYPLFSFQYFHPFSLLLTLLDYSCWWYSVRCLPAILAISSAVFERRRPIAFRSRSFAWWQRCLYASNWQSSQEEPSLWLRYRSNPRRLLMYRAYS